MSNSSEPFQCIDDYDAVIDVIKYIITFVYLGFGLFLHLSILKTVLITERKHYRSISFMQLFVTDSIASSLLLIDDILFNRLFMYVSPLCKIITPFFLDSTVSLRIIYVLMYHMKFAKAIAQIFLVLNRMSCVLMPIAYNITWQKYLPLCYFLVAVGPFGGTWNLIISQIYVDHVFGGFSFNYIRYVKWAALSMFQSIYILTALGFTVVCTFITLWKLKVLSGRLKSAEKSLCLSSLFVSVSFLMVGGTQMMYVSCSVCRSSYDYILQFLAFDVFTVGSGLMMIVFNKQLRTHIFCKKTQSPQVLSVNVRNIRHTQSAQFSTVHNLLSLTV